jgi:hypothetical protein
MTAGGVCCQDLREWNGGLGANQGVYAGGTFEWAGIRGSRSGQFYGDGQRRMRQARDQHAVIQALIGSSHIYDIDARAKDAAEQLMQMRLDDVQTIREGCARHSIDPFSR